MAQAGVRRGSLAGDLGALLESEEASDVSLVVSDYQLPVHRALLAARSSVFAAMLLADMRESRTGVIEIADVEQQVVQQMLCFIYTDHVPRLDTYAAQLLAVADKYDIGALKQLCEKKLAEAISTSNAAAMASLAVAHSCSRLTEAVTDYVRAHNEVLGTSGWEDLLLSNPRTALEVCRLVAAKPPEKSTEAQKQRSCLADDMAALLESGDGADVTLEAGGCRLPAHRALLVARCPALAAVPRVLDVEEQVLSEVLRFLYTDRPPLLVHLTHEILVVACKYSLPALAKLCEQQLAERLSVANAAACAVLAVEYSCSSLTSVAVEFIRRHVMEVTATKGWGTALLHHAEAAARVSCLVRAAAEAVAPKVRAGSMGEELTQQLSKAARKGDVGQVAALLAAGAPPEARLNAGCTVLHLAAGAGHVEATRVLLHEGADAHARDKNSCTPLHRAAYKGHPSVVRLLAAASADVNAVTGSGDTPLHTAAARGHLETALALLEAGALKDASNSLGHTPLDVAEIHNHHELAEILK